MDASVRTHETPTQFDNIGSLAKHLLHYLQDLVDAKRLLRTFRVSPHEFPQALLIRSVVDYLRHYPQDLVDAKRLLRYFRVSAREFAQALLVIDEEASDGSSQHSNRQ